ncbi:hypothetical protein ABZ922_37865 [Streptomyces shenzhenensis]|uniref:hypothetical protein n=1 Tax=Streptomyces shenzhenensis TaxID=943815 RepID=UPI0033DA60EB
MTEIWLIGMALGTGVFWLLQGAADARLRRRPPPGLAQRPPYPWDRASHPAPAWVPAAPPGLQGVLRRGRGRHRRARTRFLRRAFEKDGSRAVRGTVRERSH